MENPLRVLILEDSAPDAELAVRALQAAGWELDWERAETAEEFTRALGGQSWDLILADFSVLGFGAVTALEHVRERRLEIPLVVVSGSIGEEMAVKLLRAGAADFVIKGHLHRLGPVVERAVRESDHRRRHRQAEEERRVLAERWQLLLDHASDGVAVHQAIRDPQGRMTDFRYLEWNHAAERILGVRREQIVGRSGREVFPQILGSGLLRCYERVMETGVAEQIEDYLRRSAETPQALEISCVRLDGDHFVTLIRDVTERKAAEQRLRQYAAEVALGNQALERANAELEKRNAELEEFAHVASHDLQEPLRKVVSFGDLLARSLGEMLDAKAKRYLTLMQDATRRLQTLIRDLLVMSRADRAPLKREPVRLEQCVRAALDLLSARIQETGAVIQIEPLPTLVVDSAQICQLYQNLLSNALKFGAPERKPEIRVTCEDRGEGPVLGVADNGIGIEPEYHDKIFEAFQRLHSRDRYEGSGIGLAVCRKIVNRHEGAIWVESQPGAGSHFRFRLGGKTTAEDSGRLQRETISGVRA
jgi:PAS domain S-box-containing protein